MLLTSVIPINLIIKKVSSESLPLWGLPWAPLAKWIFDCIALCIVAIGVYIFICISTLQCEGRGVFPLLSTSLALGKVPDTQWDWINNCFMNKCGPHDLKNIIISWESLSTPIAFRFLSPSAKDIFSIAFREERRERNIDATEKHQFVGSCTCQDGGSYAPRPAWTGVKPTAGMCPDQESNLHLSVTGRWSHRLSLTGQGLSSVLIHDWRKKQALEESFCVFCRIAVEDGCLYII